MVEEARGGTKSAGRRADAFLAPRLGLLGLASAAAALAGSATVLGFFDRYHYLLDILAQFRVQYAIVLGICGAILLGFRRRRQAATFVALAVVNAALVAPLYFGGKKAAPNAQRAFRAVLINVNTENKHRDIVKEFIRETLPDFAVVEEVDTRWLKALEELRGTYPYWETNPRSDNMGIALLSRHPLEKAEIFFIGDSDIGSVWAEIEISGRKVLVVGTHPTPPGAMETWRLRNEQLTGVAKRVAERKEATVVMGDFNATPWCHQFKRFADYSGLVDSGKGRGAAFTWPVFLWPFSIPIDHCLHSADLVVVSRRLGPNVGSDHYPLVVDFAFAE